MGSDPITPEAAGRPSREYRATVALLVSGVFTLLVVLLYRQTISSIPALAAARLVGPVMGAVIELVIGFGLAVRLRWAATAMTPALWILAATGALSFLISVAGGSLDIPIGMVLAIWALRAPGRGAPAAAGAGQAPGRIIAPVLVAGLAVVAAWPLIVPMATQPGGPLIAAATELHLELETAPCSVAGASAHEPPETIDVVVRWTWTRNEPIRAGTDVVVLGWATMGGPGESGGFYLDEPIPQEPGITEEDRSALFAVYRSELALRGFEPGSLTIRLRRPHELDAGPGLVQVVATYAHHYTGMIAATPQGLWTRHEVVDCAW